MYRVVAGLKIGKPGYKEIVITPKPDGRLNYAKATYESRYGRIESGWKLDKNHLKVNVVIPPNTTAMIVLPKTTVDNVFETGKLLSKKIEKAKEIDDNVVFEVGSGKYEFDVVQVKE